MSDTNAMDCNGASKQSKEILEQWMPRLGSRPNAKYRLYCFSHAGGSASLYYSWNNLLPESIEVCPIQLPGREERIDLAPFSDMEQLLDILVSLVIETIDRPYGIYGHSLGASIGFEVARRVKKISGKEPVHLFVGAHRSPCQPYSYPSIKYASDPELLEMISIFNGLPKPSALSAEMMTVMLPTIRADLLLCESYRYQQDSTLDYPITVFHGCFDKNVKENELSSWKTQTQGTVEIISLDGEHFFLNSHKHEVLEKIQSALS